MTERIIYILRHGKAEVLAHHDDYRRRLTSVGRKDARLLAKHLVVAEVSVDRMVCSAAPRAQTDRRSCRQLVGPFPESSCIATAICMRPIRKNGWVFCAACRMTCGG